MKQQRDLALIPPLHPARLAAAILRRAFLEAHSRSAAGPSDMELHSSVFSVTGCKNPALTMILLAFQK